MSDVEETLAFQLIVCRIPFAREVKLPGRKFAYDFQVDDLLIEIQGGVWAGKLGRQSGHTSGTGITRDCEKQNFAVLNGYRPLAFTPKMVNDGVALDTIEKARRK